MLITVLAAGGVSLSLPTWLLIVGGLLFVAGIYLSRTTMIAVGGMLLVFGGLLYFIGSYANAKSHV